MTLRALFFDLDETIAPDDTINLALVRELVAAVAAAHGVDPARLVGALDAAASDLWDVGPAADYAMRIGISPWEGLWGPFGPSAEPLLAALHAFVPGFRAAAWRTALAASGIASPETAEALERRFASERRARQAAYPWSAAVLAELRPRYRLGMITNGAPDMQRLKLAGTGLAHWFDPIVVSGELGAGKPEPAIFAHALALAQAAPDEAVMIGDSWHRDITGALGAGWRAAIWINPAAAPPPAHGDHPGLLVAADLRAVPALVAGLG
ncbi:MAG TPA: HAD family hydrolase [Ktedonobacterales bacterium]|nr:HAD family hydrolase [Ktedonobacterales bacterium]